LQLALARAALGIHFRAHGAMGRRTRYQQAPTAQLTLLVDFGPTAADRPSPLSRFEVRVCIYLKKKTKRYICIYIYIFLSISIPMSIYIGGTTGISAALSRS